MAQMCTWTDRQRLTHAVVRSFKRYVHSGSSLINGLDSVWACAHLTATSGQTQCSFIPAANLRSHRQWLKAKGKWRRLGGVYTTLLWKILRASWLLHKTVTSRLVYAVNADQVSASREIWTCSMQTWQHFDFFYIKVLRLPRPVIAPKLFPKRGWNRSGSHLQVSPSGLSTSHFTTPPPN